MKYIIWLIVVGVVLIAVSNYQRKVESLSDNKVGSDNTFYGRVPRGNYGDRNTIIGSTDDKGNTIITQPMAVGYNAHAGPGSISIGVNAGASEINENSDSTLLNYFFVFIALVSIPWWPSWYHRIIKKNRLDQDGSV